MKFENQRFRTAIPNYKKSGGGNTTNPEEAKVDMFGNLELSGVTSECYQPHEIYGKPSVLSFNPTDPCARQLAFEARSAFADMSSEANDYADKFEVMSYANNVSSIINNKLSKLREEASKVIKSNE